MDVLLFLGKATGIGISYDASVQDRPISVQVDGALLEQALYEILLPIDLSYRALSERAILVVPADAQSTTRRTARTDQNGHYAIAGMRSGTYRFRTVVPGFFVDRSEVTLQGGQNVERDLRLRIGAIEETVTVQTGVEQRPPSRPDPSGLRELIARFQGKRIQPPIKVADARPVYPAALRDEGIEGTVVLEGSVGPSGFLQNLKVVGSAHPDFDRAALDAVNQWQFEPTRLWGVPTDTPINVTVRFRRQQ